MTAWCPLCGRELALGDVISGVENLPPGGRVSVADAIVRCRFCGGDFQEVVVDERTAREIAAHGTPRCRSMRIRAS